MSTIANSRIYIPPAIHKPCQLLRSSPGFTHKERRNSESDLSALAAHTRSFQGRFFGVETRTCGDFYQGVSPAWLGDKVADISLTTRCR